MTPESVVSVSLHDNVAVLKLCRGKGNALNPTLVEELLEALRQPEVAEQGRALVLTGDGGFFSAGLDLVELSELGEGRLFAFLDRLQGLLASVYVWPRPVVAAVNGHAVAGGCLLALAADWRVLARGPARLGLNEISLGLPLPQAGLEIARAELSPAAWAEVVYGGELFDVDAAMRLGLANELVDPEELLENAIERARRWALRPEVAFHRVKAGWRDRVLLRIRKDHEQHQEEWVRIWQSAEARASIQAAVERLTEKR